LLVGNIKVQIYFSYTFTFALSPGQTKKKIMVYMLIYGKYYFSSRKKSEHKLFTDRMS